MEPTPDRRASSPYALALRDELVGAHRRLARRRQRRAFALAAVVLVVLAGLTSVFVSSLHPDEAAADVLAVQPLPDGTTQVTIIDTHASLQDIRASLAANRIPNQVDGVVTGPSLVGRFVSVGVRSSERVQVTADHRSLTVPAGYKGELLVTVGLPAKPGQAYGQPTSAFDDGEPLAGFPTPEDAPAVAAAARALGITVRLFDDADAAVSTVPAGARAQYAVMLDDHTMRIRLRS